MKLFGQHIHAPVVMLAVTEFVFVCAAFMSWAAYFLSSGAGVDGVPASPTLPYMFAFGTAVVVGMTSMGLYQLQQRYGIEGVLVRLLAALGIAAVCIAVLELMLPIGVERALWGASFASSLAVLGIGRVLFVRFLDNNSFRRRVLVYGSGQRAASLLKLRRRSDQRGFQIEAFVPAPGDRGTLDDPRVTPLQGSLLEYARANDVNEIVVAMDDRRSGFPIKDLLECKFAGIAVVDLLSFLERETGRVKVDLVNPAWLIFSDGFSTKPGRMLASRVLDLVLASLLAIVTLPVMLIVAVAIFVEDGGPVLYRQRRVGLMGTTFTLLKFRSMRTNAESDGKPSWAHARDPRVTRVGKIIRKLRFDELPQLINVIRGDMGLVGPRPERPEFVTSLAQKIPYYQERHVVKPGITGWAQLCYPYGSSEEDSMEKLQYDLYYVKHRSIIFDLVVLLQTVEVVLWRKGAR